MPHLCNECAGISREQLLLALQRTLHQAHVTHLYHQPVQAVINATNLVRQPVTNATHSMQRHTTALTDLAEFVLAGRLMHVSHM